jgi:enamine deaminase RidA (YjgF/YER057c/UK114 family)
MGEHIRLNPDSLFDAKPWGFHQIQISRGQRFVHIAGQAAMDVNADLVGAGDPDAQMQMCLDNIDRACIAADIARSDIASLRIYAVDYEAEQAPQVIARLTAFFGAEQTPPATLVCVPKLAIPGHLIEIEATAIA